MKKYFIIAVAALVALASCSKNETDFSSKKSNAISFSAVAAKNTKALITGTTYKTTDPHFGIFAYALTSGTWAVNHSTAQLYMDDVEISYVDADKIWEPAATYYWPLSGTLTFIGYSPYDCNGTVAYDKATQALTVTNFTQVAEVDDQEDLMWATTNADLSDNQATYTSELQTSTKTGVNEVFHHALSQVCFAVKKATGLSGYVITVDSLKFTAYSKGTLTVTEDSPAWSDQSTGLTFWAAKADSVLVDNAFRAYGEANLPVPQTLAASTQQFTIYYKLATTGGVDLGSTSKTVDLRVADGVTSWANNTKYIYNITIDLNKIYFSPSIVEWTSPAVEQAIDVQ